MEIDYLKVQFSGSSDEIADALDFIQAAPFGQLTLTISCRGGREDQITIETSEDCASPATVRSLLQKVTKLSDTTANTDYESCVRKSHTLLYEQDREMGLAYMHCLDCNFWHLIGQD
jgi:hypothetical protein